MHLFDTVKNQNHVFQTTHDLEYLVLSSEPSDTGAQPKLTPSFNFANRYIAHRRVMRTIRYLKGSYSL